MATLRRVTRFPAAFALMLLAATPAAAQLQATVYVSGLSSPVGLVQDPSDASIQYVIEQGGLIKVVQSGTVLPTPFLDLTTSILPGGERGLLGLAFPSNYGATGRFWVKFTNPAGNNVVARFRRSAANPRVADPSTRFDLLWPGGTRWIPQPFSNHNGGHLAFGPDGYLYIGTGDGGSGNDPDHRAQDPTSLLGKFLRVNVHVADGDPQGYDVPPDNPFIGSGLPGVLPEIWSFGWRNPWRYSFDDPALGGTGALVVGDVGQVAREEIDYEPAGRGGRNYGWRNREGTLSNITTLPPAYEPLTDPIFDYGRDAGIAVTGGFVYRGSALGASYSGRYFFADFGSGRVWSLSLAIGPAGDATATGIIEHTGELGGSALGNISSFGVDAAGELYLCSFNGRIFKITRAVRAPMPLANIDLPGPGATVSQPFLLAGWMFDAAASSGTGINTIHVWAFPAAGAARFLGVATLGGDRPDVGGIFGTQFRPSGWGLSVSGLPPGEYRLMVFGWVTALGTFGVLRTVDVTIVASTAMSIDIPAQGSTLPQPFHLGGWALDRAATAGTGVDTIHVWAYPVAPAGPPRFVGVPALGGSRPDVGAFFGTRFTPSGYNMLVSGLPAGTYDLVVFVHSAVSNSFDAAQVVRITVQ